MEFALSVFEEVVLSVGHKSCVRRKWNSSLTTVTASHLPSCFAVFPVLDFSDPFSTEVKPRILLMGLRRSGKSSIQKVVFHKMSPNETLFLESTNKICREDVSNSSFVNFQIWDFPGQIDFFDPTFDYEMIFRGTGALIFVIDSQVRLHLGVWWDCNAWPCAIVWVWVLGSGVGISTRLAFLSCGCLALERGRKISLHAALTDKQCSGTVCSWQA